MTQSTKNSLQEGISLAEVEALQQRVAQEQLVPEDYARLGKLIQQFLTLMRVLEQPRLRLAQLRHKLFGERREPPAPPAASADTPVLPVAAAPAAAEPETSQGNQDNQDNQETETEPGTEKDAATPAPAPQRRGHGRRAARDCRGAEFVASGVTPGRRVSVAGLQG